MSLNSILLQAHPCHHLRSCFSTNFLVCHNEKAGQGKSAGQQERGREGERERERGRERGRERERDAKKTGLSILKFSANVAS